MSIKKLKSIHGRDLYLGADGTTVAREGLAVGGEDRASIVMSGPTTVAIFEDFLRDQTYATGGAGDTGGTASQAAGLGDSGETKGYFRRLSGGTGVTSSIVNSTNGVYRMTTTTAGTKTVGGGSGLFGRTLSWKANQGPGNNSGKLRMGARVKKDIYTDGTHGIFVGFTDRLAQFEMPIHDTGAAAANNTTATNAFGIMHNVAGGTEWRGVSVNGDTLQVDTGLGNVPSSPIGKWTELEVEMHRGISDTGGSITFYIDGIAVGYNGAGPATATALTPCVAIYDTGGAATVDIDWINVSAPRDTGT